MGTIPTTATIVANLAIGQIGVKESPAGSNRQKYGAEYGMNGVPWCAIFVWWCFKHAGYDIRNVSEHFFYTPSFRNDLKSDPDWKRVDTKDARKGDIAFFDFPGGRNDVEHVGIVLSNAVDSLLLRTVDGNTSINSDSNGGMVMERSRSYKDVAYVFRPPYNIVTPKRYTLTRTLYVRKLRYIRGNDVRKVQSLVGAKIDGIYGPKTAAKVAAWQRKMRITVDGVFGPQSAKAAGWLYRK